MAAGSEALRNFVFPSVPEKQFGEIVLFLAKGEEQPAETIPATGSEPIIYDRLAGRYIYPGAFDSMNYAREN